MSGRFCREQEAWLWPPPSSGCPPVLSPEPLDGHRLLGRRARFQPGRTLVLAQERRHMHQGDGGRSPQGGRAECPSDGLYVAFPSPTRQGSDSSGTPRPMAPEGL